MWNKPKLAAHSLYVWPIDRTDGHHLNPTTPGIIKPLKCVNQDLLIDLWHIVTFRPSFVLSSVRAHHRLACVHTLKCIQCIYACSLVLHVSWCLCAGVCLSVCMPCKCVETVVFFQICLVICVYIYMLVCLCYALTFSWSCVVCWSICKWPHVLFHVLPFNWEFRNL